LKKLQTPANFGDLLPPTSTERLEAIEAEKRRWESVRRGETKFRGEPRWLTPLITMEVVLMVLSFIAAPLYLSIDSETGYSGLLWTLNYGQAVGLALVVLGPVNLLFTLWLVKGEWDERPHWQQPTLQILNVLTFATLLFLLFVALIFVVAVVVVILAFTKGGLGGD
jgi:hypothetical protein